MCRLCSQQSSLCVCLSVCSGAQCVSVSGSGPDPAPLSLSVFVCADLFQQFPFGQALGASSLSVPVWTKKPLTTFDSVNILVPFNMQPELLSKIWGGGWLVERGMGRVWGMKRGAGVECKCSKKLTLMTWNLYVVKKKKSKTWYNSKNFFSFMCFLVLATHSSSDTCWQYIFFSGHNNPASRCRSLFWCQPGTLRVILLLKFHKLAV